MKVTELMGREILILGFGREGQSSLNFLLHQKGINPGQIAVADQKPLKELSILKGEALAKIDPRKCFWGNHYSYWLTWPKRKSGIVIKSPGIKIPADQRKHLKKRGIQITTGTNIFGSNFPGKIVAITGTKGKSTTASLIEAALKEANFPVYLVGNIGQPALELLVPPYSLSSQSLEEIWAVLELSSYQTEDLNEDFSPQIAVILNLLQDHLDYHQGQKNYHRAKLRLLQNLSSGSHFVYNSDFSQLKIAAKKLPGQSWDLSKQALPVGSQSFLVGQHNQLNLQAAWTVARILEISPQIFRSAVKKFSPLKHRLELVGEFRGICFYDDAISTTPESTMAAIEALKTVETIFLGGQDRGYDFSQLAKIIGNSSIKNIVIFPDSGERIKSSLQDICPEEIKKIKFLATDQMSVAVKFAYQQTTAGKICLLSCASPSYSLWNNFEEKGEDFQRRVLEFA